MNLSERMKSKDELWCPLNGEMICMRLNEDTGVAKTPCAHYNPKTDECFHVEAARAQVKAAGELSLISQTLECETINICWRER